MLGDISFPNPHPSSAIRHLLSGQASARRKSYSHSHSISLNNFPNSQVCIMRLDLYEICMQGSSSGWLIWLQIQSQFVANINSILMHTLAQTLLSIFHWDGYAVNSNTILCRCIHLSRYRNMLIR